MQLGPGATITAAMQSSDPLGIAQLAVHSDHKVPCNGLPCARSKSASGDERGRDSGSPFHKDKGAHQSAGSDLICLDHISTTMLLPRRNFSPRLGASECVNSFLSSSGGNSPHQNRYGKHAGEARGPARNARSDRVAFWPKTDRRLVAGTDPRLSLRCNRTSA